MSQRAATVVGVLDSSLKDSGRYEDLLTRSGFVLTVTLGIERRPLTYSLRLYLPKRPQMELSDAAEAPKRSVIGGETIEEHSLTDRIDYERYKNQQSAGTDLAANKSIVKRTQLRHPRP